MRIIKGHRYAGVCAKQEGMVIGDLCLDRCSFHGCRINGPDDPGRRIAVQNLRVVDCEAIRCTIRAARVEDAIVDGLMCPDLFVWASCFRHVTLRGRIGNIKIQPCWPVPNESIDRDMMKCADKYYESVDWALDIRHGEFEGLEIRGVPSSLIRMDPETQCVIPRPAVERIDLAGLEVEDELFRRVLEMLFRRGEPYDYILVAGKRSRHFDMMMRGIKRLRQLGLAR